MLIVHHLENSRSQRILWMMEELGLDYEIKHYKRDPETQLAPRELREIHPLGKSPVLEDNGRIIAETGNIIEHLLDHHARGRLATPHGTLERDDLRYWLHYAEGSSMPPLLIKLVNDNMETRSPGLIKPIIKMATGQIKKRFLQPQIDTHFGYVDNHLAKSGWFVGQAFSAADIMMSFPLEAAATRAGTGSLPAIGAFLEKIHARPAYIKALEKGGPYAYA